MKPSAGRIVHYKLSCDDAKIINNQSTRDPYPTQEGDIFPGIIARVRGLTHVDLKVFVPWCEDYWVDCYHGIQPGQWRWPEPADGDDLGKIMPGGL